MSAAGETMLMTVFLKHDQSNNLDAIQTRLKDADWWERFPPEGVEIVSWVVAMGFGQIVTLRLPPSKWNWAEDWNSGRLEALMRLNVRVPDLTMGDMNAQFAANAIAENRLQQLAAKYGAAKVEFSADAAKRIKQFEEAGFGNLPVCMAKTQYSFSHDASLLGAPTGFTLPIKDARLSAGAGFVYMLCGDMMTMPGLAKKPGGEAIDIDEQGNIIGMF